MSIGNMSPFAQTLNALRLRHRLRQSELAELMGFDQSYISALEIGHKGPPTPEFIDKLCAVLELSDSDAEDVRQAVAISDRRLVLPPDAPTQAYVFFNTLRGEIDTMHPKDFEVLQSMLEMKAREPLPVRRLRRRSKEEAHNLT